MLFTSETIILPSRFENTFLIFDKFSCFVTATMAGPFPDIDAPTAPFSIKSEIIFGYYCRFHFLLICF